MYGKITYSYTPNGWCPKRFLALGGFTAVFLNYNKSAFIEKSVASVLGQDFEILEIFFLDDASTDGSGDTMEQLVRQYRGRHKVTVVRNTENQHITGQWNIVSKHATGKWFGMFCADDIARLNRVSQAATIVARIPTLKGFCTSGIEINYQDGTTTRKISTGYSRNEATGETSAFEIAHGGTAVVGSTAFWHKSLFAKPLPKAPLDDLLLRWVLHAQNLDSKNVVWTWETDIETVDYSIGTGISTEGRQIAEEKDSPAKRWVKAQVGNRHFAAVTARTWSGILEYYRKNGVDASLLSFAKCEMLLNKFVAGGTWRRLPMLPRMLTATIAMKEPAMKRYALMMVMKRMMLEFFGLRVASLIRRGSL